MQADSSLVLGYSEKKHTTQAVGYHRAVHTSCIVAGLDTTLTV